VTIATTLRHIRQRLQPVSDTPALDAQVLLAHVLEVSRSWLLAHPEAELSGEAENRLQAALARLESGEPLPYVLGHWEFYGLDLSLSPDVLIPRPETELLVEQAIDWLKAHPQRRRAADVGSGSGCIAVALAVHVPDLRLVAGDISLAALKIAQRNAVHHHVAERIDFLASDLLPPVATHFDLICANLPYIPTKVLKSLAVYRSEPSLALAGGLQGLDLIQRLLFSAPSRLAQGGLILLEIEASQGEAACRLATQAFPQAKVHLLQDLAGRDRLVRVELLTGI
jgi:release factor glutamine methyltransferase